MTNDELNEKIRQACTHAAPDVLDAVLSDCNEQKGRVILMTTENKKKTWAVRMAGLAAGSASSHHSAPLCLHQDS